MVKCCLAKPVKGDTNIDHNFCGGEVEGQIVYYYIQTMTGSSIKRKVELWIVNVFTSVIYIEGFHISILTDKLVEKCQKNIMNVHPRAQSPRATRLLSITLNHRQLYPISNHT